MNQKPVAPEKQILVIMPRHVGDVIMALPALQILHKTQPGCVIDALVDPSSGYMTEALPYVRNTFDSPLKKGRLNFAGLCSVARQLKAVGYSQVIIFPDTVRTALFTFMTKIPVRTGTASILKFGLVNDQRKMLKDRKRSYRYADLTLPRQKNADHTIPEPKLHTNSETIKNTLAKFSLDPKPPVLIVSPGASEDLKCWNPHNFLDVVKHWIANGGQIWLTGVLADCDKAAIIYRGLSDREKQFCCDLTDQTSLSELIALVASATFVVCNDSGMLHIAGALSIPLIGIFGPTSKNPVFPAAPNCRFFSYQLPCSPCNKKTCPLKHRECMLRRDTAQVIEMLPKISNAMQ